MVHPEERYESDSMGQVAIPTWAYWGAQTQRAIENFVISNHTIPIPMIRALALIKKQSAQANQILKLLDQELANAIILAAGEIVQGNWDKHFPLDIFQTGSATSTNMNANEVISNRANELLGAPLGLRKPVHPNDHVNMGQSSNDVIPAAVQIATRLEAEKLVHVIRNLSSAIRKKASEFSSILKLGRTHLQDAVPMTLGQEIGAWASQFEKCSTRLQQSLVDLEELPLGGTAIGTGLNCHKDFGPLVTQGIAQETNVLFRVAKDRFELIAARDAQVALMGTLNTLATVIMKVANDLRILGSGPRGALGEIILPSLQPGSSIMPGKVNPVIPEMLIQVAAHIHGKALSVTMGGQQGPLELNMAHPLIAFETLESISILINALQTFESKCIIGLEADVERCRYWIDWSLAMVTPLNSIIGYDRAAQLAYQAFKEKRKISDLVVELGILSLEDAQRILDPHGLTGQD